MSTIDLTPLYRTMVGFDRMASMIDTAQRLDGAQGYPPYNIEHVGEDAYAIEIAVAGFADGDLDIELKEGQLTVVGKKTGDSDARKYLHRGIAERGFIRRFQLADHVVVTGAQLENGLLRIELVRELPEAMKPRKIAIGAAEPAPSIESKVSKKKPVKAA
ncbi:MAG: Hsp20 family protein [Pseudomonadota bacterium]